MMTSNNGSTRVGMEDAKTLAFTIAVSADLFNMEQENHFFSPGPAFLFVKALDSVNTRLLELEPGSEEVFQVIVLSNSTNTDLIDSIKHNWSVKPILITKGNSLIDCLRENHINVYLSADATEVKEAMSGGIAAATMFSPEKPTEVSETQLRVAFDGDAVLFSDESEQVFKKRDLQGFLDNERKNVDLPLKHKGPLMGFLEALRKLHQKFYSKGHYKDCPIRTYLVTARDAGNAGFRALNTLHSWRQGMDEAFFLSGSPKGPMLEMIRPHIFFDDQMCHVDNALSFGTVAAHVPYDQWAHKKK